MPLAPGVDCAHGTALQAPGARRLHALPAGALWACAEMRCANTAARGVPILVRSPPTPSAGQAGITLHRKHELPSGVYTTGEGPAPSIFFCLAFFRTPYQCFCAGLGRRRSLSQWQKQYRKECAAGRPPRVPAGLEPPAAGLPCAAGGHSVGSAVGGAPQEGYTFYLRPDDGSQMGVNSLDVSQGAAGGMGCSLGQGGSGRRSRGAVRSAPAGWQWGATDARMCCGCRAGLLRHPPRPPLCSPAAADPHRQQPRLPAGRAGARHGQRLAGGAAHGAPAGARRHAEHAHDGKHARL